MTRQPESRAVPEPGEQDKEATERAFARMECNHRHPNAVVLCWQCLTAAIATARAEGDAAGYLRGFADARERAAATVHGTNTNVSETYQHATGPTRSAAYMVAHEIEAHMVAALRALSPEREGERP